MSRTDTNIENIIHDLHAVGMGIESGERVPKERFIEAANLLEQLAATVAKLPKYANGEAFVPGVDEAWDSDGNRCRFDSDLYRTSDGRIMSRYANSSKFYPTAAECEEAESTQKESE